MRVRRVAGRLLYYGGNDGPWMGEDEGDDVRRWPLLLVLVILAACTPYPAVPVPTPDLGALYTHPGGVFSMRLPTSWSVSDLSEGAGLMMTFAPPRADRVMLTVCAVRLAAPLDDAAFRATMDAYLAAAPLDRALSVQDQAAMGDGSWRVTGLREMQDQLVPVNVFMQRDGAFFSVLEVVIPTNDPVTATLLERAINSYTVNPDASWPVGSVAALPQPPENFILAGGNLAFSGLLTYTDAEGHFHISGRIANRAPYAMTAVAVRGTLYDFMGTVLAEQIGSTPVTLLLDGEYAPFDIRFEGSRPSAAVRFGVRADGQVADSSQNAYYGPQFFDWEDRAEYDEAGQLHVRGTIWNLGEVEARNVQAVITLFDAADRVTGYVAVEVAEGSLAAGDSARFDAPVPPMGSEPARYLLSVQAVAGP